jgi:hypothetical protein
VPVGTVKREWSAVLQAAATAARADIARQEASAESHRIAVKAAAKADKERERIAVTEALEQRESELERELKESDLTRQQKAELNRQLKNTRRELAAARRPKNRFTTSKESCKHLNASVLSMSAADRKAKHLTGPLSAGRNRQVSSPLPRISPREFAGSARYGQFAAS